MSDENRRYFISAYEIETGGFLAEEIDAEGFCEALLILLDKARARFAGRAWRVTGVTERPRIEESGPLACAMRFARSEVAA